MTPFMTGPIVSGRLRHGRLNGLVTINGIVSNDPKTSCSKNVSPGLGFIGQLKDGIPVGVCWRGLLGGSWIFGKVNKDGLFSGKIFCQYYQTR